MRISEIKGTDAIQALAEMLEPISIIAQDEEVRTKARETSIAAGGSLMLKRYPKEVLQILAALDGVDAKEYNPSLAEIPAKLMECLNDEDVQKLFFLQAPKEEQKSSGDASEDTAE